MTGRYRTIVVVHVLSRRTDGQVLFLERAGTGEGEGQLCLPGGHLEDASRWSPVRSGRQPKRPVSSFADLPLSSFLWCTVATATTIPGSGSSSFPPAGMASRSTASPANAPDFSAPIPRTHPATRSPTPPLPWRRSAGAGRSPSTAARPAYRPLTMARTPPRRQAPVTRSKIRGQSRRYREQTKTPESAAGRTARLNLLTSAAHADADRGRDRAARPAPADQRDFVNGGFL